MKVPDIDVAVVRALGEEVARQRKRGEPLDQAAIRKVVLAARRLSAGRPARPLPHRPPGVDAAAEASRAVAARREALRATVVARAPRPKQAAPELLELARAAFAKAREKS